MIKQSLVIAPNDLTELAYMVSQLAKTGSYGEAEFYLSHLRAVDREGRWAYAGWLYLGSLRDDPPAHSQVLETALADPRTNDYLRGIVHFIVGDIDAGLADWQRMSDPAVIPLATTFTPNVETLFPASAIQDLPYQALLDDLGIGRKWTAHLREMVAQLEPITGIHPSDPAPQHVSSR